MKKLLSLVITVTMLIGMLGNVAIAAETTPSANLISVAYSDKLDLYVTVASDGQIYTSGDGINWGPGEKFAPSTNLGVIEGNGYYVTPDAIIWNPNLEEFVLTAGNKLYRSSDGFNWGDAITPKAGSSTLVIHTLFWDGSKYWAATKTGGEAAYANDNTLTSWTSTSTGASKPIDGFAKASTGRLFACTTLSNSKTLYYTDNGTTWTDGTTSGVNPYRTTSIQYSKMYEKIFLAGGAASDKSSTKNGAVGRADVVTGITEARIELKADSNNATNIPVVSDFVVYDTYDSSNTITKEEIIAVSFTGAISYRQISNATDIAQNRKWNAVSPATGETANTKGLTSVIRGKNGYVAVGGDPSNHDRTSNTGAVAIFIPTDYTQGYTIGKFDDNTQQKAYSLYISGDDEINIPESETATSAYTTTVRDIAGKPIANFSNTVVWSVSGENTDGISIQNGVLTVAAGADAQKIVITATDSTDESIYGEKTVIIKSTAEVITPAPLTSYLVYRDGIDNNVFKPKYSTLEEAVLDGEPCSLMTGTELQDDGNQMFLYISDEEVVGTGNKDMVFSFSVYPDDSMDYIRIATSGHAAIVPAITFSDLEAGKWNEISVVIDGATSTNTLYINGEYYAQSVKTISSGTLRLCVYSAQEALYGTTAYIDNLALSIGSANFPAITTSSLVLDGMYINGYSGMSYANIESALNGTNPDTTFKFFEQGTEVVNTSALAQSGAHVAVYTDGVFVSEYILGTADYVIGEYNGYSNGAASEKFGIGTYTAGVEVKTFGESLEVMAVLAQYDSGFMEKCNVEYYSISEKDVAEVSLDVTETEGTYLKFFLFEKDTLAPLMDAVTVQPYSDVYVENVAPMYEGFTSKAATFSYDDGVAYDINTIESLDKYGAKATFNLVAKQSDGTTDRLLNYYKDKGTTDEERFEYIKDLYKNHEIANHSYSHPPVQLEEGQTSQDSGGNTLTGISGDAVISQIANNHSYVKDNLGIDMTGIAWPHSNPYNRSDYADVRDAILNSGYKYARNHTNSMSFDLPADWFKWSTTAHIAKMPSLTDEFVALPDDGSLKLLYIWGHSYEYAAPETYGSGDWTTLEQNLAKLQAEGVWFGTNKEVYDYVNAINKVTKEINTVTNNSDMTVYLNINGVNVELDAGEKYSINESQLNLPEIACWGDSLTLGKGSSDRSTKSYPSILAKLSGATVYNMGVGGETATTIAAKQGALDIVFTEGFTIPASCSESIEIKFAASNGGVVTPRDAAIGGWTPCTINGVEGKMEIVVDTSVWPRVLKSAHFKRNVSGEAVTVNIGDKLIPYAQKIKPDINIIFSGTNGAWTSANESIPSDYTANIPEFLELLDSQRKLSNNPDKYIIIGLTAGDEARWSELDTAMEQKFGENFLDVRAFLSSEEAFEQAGITPSESDTAAFSTGAVPPSFLSSDGTHFNDTGYALIAHCVYNKLIALDYLD